MMQAFIFRFLCNFVCQFCIKYLPSLPLYHSYSTVYSDCRFIRLLVFYNVFRMSIRRHRYSTSYSDCHSFGFQVSTLYSDCHSFGFQVSTSYSDCPYFDIVILHSIRNVLSTTSLFYIVSGLPSFDIVILHRIQIVTILLSYFALYQHCNSAIYSTIQMIYSNILITLLCSQVPN